MLPEFEFCRKAFEENGLSLTAEVYEKLDIYAEMLVETNKVMNLTAITEPEEVLIKHFIYLVTLKHWFMIYPFFFHTQTFCMSNPSIGLLNSP